MYKRVGGLIVVSAPSGAGKTSLCKEITARHPNILHSVSYTTRAPRPGEANDREYTFVTVADFKKMADAGEFAEWAEVHGNYYGTSKKRLDAMLAQGFDVILDIDVQGAAKIRHVYEDGVYVFVLPPSMDVLLGRLHGRGSDSAEVIERRMKKARQEIGSYINYDYVILNDDFEAALRGLMAVIESRRMRLKAVDAEWVADKFLR